MPDLACLLILQEIFTLKGHQGPQPPGITDTGLLRLFLVKSHFFLTTIACAIFAQVCKNSGLEYLLDLIEMDSGRLFTTTTSI